MKRAEDAIIYDSINPAVFDAATLERLSRTRVAFITDIPTPYVVALLRALTRHIDLSVVFSAENSTRGMPWRFSTDFGFRHSVVGGATIRRADAEGIDYYFDPRLLAHLYRIRPDVIISAGFSFPTFYSKIYAQITGAKLLIYSDGTSVAEQNYGRLRRFARDYLVPRASGVIAKSKLAAERFTEMGAAGKIVVAHHTTDLAPFLAVGKERLDTVGEPVPLRLINVGRMIPRKGLDCLLEALRRLPPTQRAVQLTLVGSGPHEAQLRAIAQTMSRATVTFAGFVDQLGLPAFYRSADAFVLPTFLDPFGIVMLEAAASGLALLGSVYAGATHELVMNQISGIRFDPHQPDDLAAAIAILADNPSLVRRMGQAAHRIALHRTPERSAEGYLVAIMRALSQHKILTD